MKILAAVFMLGVAGLAGCPSMSYLETRTTPDRANFGSYVIATPPAGTGAAGGGGVVITDAPGTWKFTLPPNVMEVVREMQEWTRISLYIGMPQVTAEPFMIITVGRERESRAEAATSQYTVTGKREYVMNGNIATEWTGQTHAGAGFCELIVRRPGTPGETGDVCHALATARNDDEQKIALAILGSIVWETTPAQ